MIRLPKVYKDSFNVTFKVLPLLTKTPEQFRSDRLIPKNKRKLPSIVLETSMRLEYGWAIRSLLQDEIYETIAELYQDFSYYYSIATIKEAQEYLRIGLAYSAKKRIEDSVNKPLVFENDKDFQALRLYWSDIDKHFELIQAYFEKKNNGITENYIYEKILKTLLSLDLTVYEIPIEVNKYMAKYNLSFGKLYSSYKDGISRASKLIGYKFKDGYYHLVFENKVSYSTYFDFSWFEIEPIVKQSKPNTIESEHIWPYDNYSDFQKRLAVSYDVPELEKKLRREEQLSLKYSEQHLKALIASNPKPTHTARLAHAFNNLELNTSRKRDYSGALYIHKHYPEKAKPTTQPPIK